MGNAGRVSGPASQDKPFKPRATTVASGRPSLRNLPHLAVAACWLVRIARGGVHAGWILRIHRVAMVMRLGARAQLMPGSAEGLEF